MFFYLTLFNCCYKIQIIYLRRQNQKQMDWIIIGGLLIIIVMQILLRPKQLNNNKEDLEKLLNEIQRSFDHIEKYFR